jgi:DNA-binding transcriptional LysR family regulator
VGRLRLVVGHASTVRPDPSTLARWEYEAPATRADTIDLRELARERWVMDHPTCPFYRQTLALCQAAGFQPDVIANTESVSVSSALVRSGLSYAQRSGHSA